MGNWQGNHQWKRNHGEVLAMRRALLAIGNHELAGALVAVLRGAVITRRGNEALHDWLMARATKGALELEAIRGR